MTLPDPRLATQLLRDLGRAHAAAEVVANLRESAPESVREVAFKEFDTASRIVDAYPAALILALTAQVEQRLGALPGSEREREAMRVRTSA